ncbi:hypothetical protein [Haloarchaeobius sp. HRN-SO-5]|uniref:hypothetical protein n=1 Tax=Haloarchaeobius sp. HRN-SO-5 TaxID=3446118 RepID=UPI003EBF00EF
MATEATDEDVTESVRALASDGALDRLDEGDTVDLRYRPREVRPFSDERLMVTGEVTDLSSAVDPTREHSGATITTDDAQYRVWWNGTVGHRETQSGLWTEVGTNARIHYQRGDD